MGLACSLTAPRLQVLTEHLATRGSPLQRNLRPEDLPRRLATHGFSVVDHIGPAEIHERYLKDRNDGYSAAEFCHFVHASIE